MDLQENICARNGCDNSYQRKTHNQKYCSDNCCRIATNEKIMIRYYENKKLRDGSKRVCLCGAKLSRYNLGTECSSCIAKRESERLADVEEQSTVILWGS